MKKSVGCGNSLIARPLSSLRLLQFRNKRRVYL